jgi:hypothetical protein
MLKPLPFGKTFLFHNQTSTSWKDLCASWLNLCFLAKPFYLMGQPFPFKETFVLHG